MGSAASLHLLTTLLLASAPAAPAAAPAPAITVDWIFGDEGESIAKLPAAFWTGSGQVLLLDGRRPKAERTLERFDPATRSRTPAVDAAAALASLRSVLVDGAGSSPPEGLEWPAGFDREGRLAAYVFDGDLFLLELASSRFERLTRTPAEESAPQLSPDGRRLAFVRGNDLFALDLASRAEARLTRDGSDTVLNGVLSWVYGEEILGSGRGFWWSDDSTAVAFLRSDESPVSLIPWVDFKPAVPRVLHQRYPKVGDANPVVTVGIVDVPAGAAGGAAVRTVWLDRSEVPYEYVLDVKWVAGSRQLAVETMNRRQDRIDVHVVERATGAWRRALTETGPAWLDHVDVHVLSDGRLVATSQRDGYTHLYRFDERGGVANQITRGPWSVRGPDGFQLAPLGAATVDEPAGLVYFTAREKSPLERHLYRARLDGSGMERVSREDGTHVVDWSPDRRHYLDRHSGHATPPSLTLRDAAGGLVARLAEPLTDLVARLDVRTPELLTVPAADGHPLPARLYTPRGFDRRRRHPVILHVYGEPGAPRVRDAWDTSDSGGILFNQLLLKDGYLVLSVDPRTATGVGRDVTTAGFRRKGEVELADFTAALHWLKAQPWVDPARVGMWGWSGGGTSTLLVMTRSTGLRAGIAVAPLTEPRYYDTKYMEAYLGSPSDNPGGYAAASLVARAKDLHGRLLIVHGTYDDNVHTQNTWHFVDEALTAGKPIDLMAYPMRKHGIADRPALRHLFGKMLEFWRLHLMPR